jgi:hypothetical protein
VKEERTEMKEGRKEGGEGSTCVKEGRKKEAKE